MPKPLRILLRLALALLILAAAIVLLRFWLDSQGRAVLAKHPPRPPRATMPGASGANSGSHPAAKLSLFSPWLGTDPEAKKLAEEFQKELSRFLGGFENGDQPLDFLDWLKKHGQPVPKDMTQAEAAAEFLRQAEKFGPFLASLREAIATGTPWDFGPRPGILDRAAQAAQTLAWSAFVKGQRLLAAFAQARMRIGQPDEARALWSDLRQAARHSDDAPGHDSYVPAGSPHHELVATARAGLTLGAWRDADLAQVSTDLASLNCLDSYRKAVSRRRDSMAAAIAECSADREMLVNALNVRFHDSDDVINRVRKSAKLANAHLASDTQLAANLAVIDQHMQVNEERFDYTRRVYLPPSEEEATMLKPVPYKNGKYQTGASPLEEMYFFLCNKMPRAPFYEEPAKSQVALDQTRIALALEAQKRSTGSYPDTLGSLPSGLPHDVATGQPYRYEKTQDGSFRLWSTGLDQTDDGGVSGKDIPYKLPNPK